MWVVWVVFIYATGEGAPVSRRSVATYPVVPIFSCRTSLLCFWEILNRRCILNGHLGRIFKRLDLLGLYRVRIIRSSRQPPPSVVMKSKGRAWCWRCLRDYSPWNYRVTDINLKVSSRVRMRRQIRLDHSIFSFGRSTLRVYIAMLHFPEDAFGGWSETSGTSPSTTRLSPCSKATLK